MDITLVEGPDGLVAHRPDCADVQAAREAGEPLMTCFGCQGDVHDLGVACHACLEDER